MPFLGKKTVPARLRRDLWLPYCLASFPHPFAGLEAYQKLREYRHLHETQYPLETITVKRGARRGQLMQTKERGKVLMNQAANSVADLAAVLLQLDEGLYPKRQERSALRIRRKATLERQKGKINKDPVDLAEQLVNAEGVVVRWADIRDAEYAQAWPSVVRHELLERSGYTAAFPQARYVEDSSRDVPDTAQP